MQCAEEILHFSCCTCKCNGHVIPALSATIQSKPAFFSVLLHSSLTHSLLHSNTLNRNWQNNYYRVDFASMNENCKEIFPDRIWIWNWNGKKNQNQLSCFLRNVSLDKFIFWTQAVKRVDPPPPPKTNPERFKLFMWMHKLF